MPIYAGETVRVFSRALNWDDTPVSSANEVDVLLTVWAGTGLPVLIDAPMVYNSSAARWEYDWTQDEPGAYRLEVRVVGPDNAVSKEVRSVVLVPVVEQSLRR